MRNPLPEARRTPPLTRVIGIGSPFGDDRAGWRVIEALRDRVPPGVELLALDRPGPALINWMTGLNRLVLIDAVDLPQAVGQILSLDRDRLAAEPSMVSSHGLGIAETLQLATTLGSLPDRLEIYAIGIDPQSPEGRVSRAVATAAALLADRLERQLSGDDADVPDTGRGRGPGPGSLTTASSPASPPFPPPPGARRRRG